MPVYPQPWPGASPYSCGGWHGPRSRMSTTSRSPGSAPSTSTGPLSMCATVRSTSRTSFEESLLGGWASGHSGDPTPKPAALDPEVVAGLDARRRGDVRVPAVVTGDRLVAHGLGLIDAENDLRHVR